jgi:hypothetical protein
VADAVTTLEDLIARASAALAAADWDGAGVLFLQALEEGESPESAVECSRPVQAARADQACRA